MHGFVGRQRELQALTQAWEAGRSAFIPIYGRRRVGKSELILHFLHGKPALYYMGKKAPAGLQVREFLTIAANLLDEPLLATYPAAGWPDALDAVMSRRPAGKKIVLVFDEFQWMVESSPERLCREALPRIYEREGVEATFEVGEYWSKTTQIDVVGLRSDGWTDLGECKWGALRSAVAVERELEQKMKHYPNRRGATLARRIFARRKRPGGKGQSGVRWHTLEELYG